MKIITQKLIEKFKVYLIQEEKAENAVEKYVRDAAAFAEWLGGREVSKKAVLEYKRELISKYSPASVNSRLSSLSSFLTFCGRGDCKIKNVKIQQQIFARTEKELTKAEYERLLQAAQSGKTRKLYYLMQTICSTGIRVSELKFITAIAMALSLVVLPRTAMAEDNVAQIGETGYPTFADAVTAAGSSETENPTITLLSDVDLDATQTISKTVTIDLGGCTITGGNVRAIHVTAGTLTLTGTGTVTTVASNEDGVTPITETSSVIRVGDGGDLMSRTPILQRRVLL